MGEAPHGNGERVSDTRRSSIIIFDCANASQTCDAGSVDVDEVIKYVTYHHEVR